MPGTSVSGVHWTTLGVGGVVTGPVTVPTPPWRAPIPSHHWLQSLEMSSSRKNAVCGRSSSPSWFGG